VVCDPRKNALLKDGSKSDRIDARKPPGRPQGQLTQPLGYGLSCVFGGGFNLG
jgi:hypothetical protein